MEYTEHHHHDKPDGEHTQQQYRRERQKAAEQRRHTLAAAKAVEDRVDVSHHRSKPAADLQPGLLQRRTRELARGKESGQGAHGDVHLRHVDDDHAKGEGLALRAQRIGTARIAAALSADVHAAQLAEQQAAVE